MKSPDKAMKEAGMKNQFEKRFEDKLQKIHNAIHRKGGIKRLDKVHQRIGRAKEKYPSVAQYYIIEVTVDEKTSRAIPIAIGSEKTRTNTVTK